MRAFFPLIPQVRRRLHGAMPPAARRCTLRRALEYLPHSTRVLRGKYNPTLRNAFPRFPPRGTSPSRTAAGTKGPHALSAAQKESGHKPDPCLAATRYAQSPLTSRTPPLGTNHLPRSVSVTNPIPGIRSTPAPPLLRPLEAHVRFATAPKMPCRNNSETRYYDYWPKMSHEKPKTPFKTFTECLILRKKS